MVESKTAPIVGRHYSLEDAESGSSAQNKAFHALIQELYKWMLSQDNFVHQNGDVVYNFSCPDWLTLKDIFKARYGAGADHYRYADQNFQMVKVNSMNKIPGYVMKDFKDGNHLRIAQVLKSWSKYTKKERTNLLDTTINIMDHIGVDSKKYFEILEGMKTDDK
jgi:hypothetical protein